MTYTIKHIAGYSPVDHYGEEIERRCEGLYPSLRAARETLKRERTAHAATHNSIPGSGSPRIDIIASTGREFCYE